LNLQQRIDGVWNSKNTEEFLEHVHSTGLMYLLDLELGNEPNHYSHKHTMVNVTGSEIGKDYISLKEVMDSYEELADSKLVGPETAGFEGEKVKKLFRDFVTTCESKLSAATVHQYYFNAEEGEQIDYTNVTIFNELQRFIVKVKREYNHEDLPLWLGESGASYGRDETGITEKYGGGFIWLDKLGLAAKSGVSVVVRQSLYGPKPLLDKEMNLTQIIGFLMSIKSLLEQQ